MLLCSMSSIVYRSSSNYLIYSYVALPTIRHFLIRFAYHKELRQCCGLLFALTSSTQIFNHTLCSQESHFTTTLVINNCTQSV
jgi:hypothetical protein